VGAQGKIGKGSAGQKKGLFKNGVNVFILSLLPGISQIRTLFKVYGAELRLLLKKNNTDHHHHLWQPRALALNTPFLLLLHPPPAPALSPRAVKISLPVSLSLGCPRSSRVVCGGMVKPVRLSSLEVLPNWGARGEASVSASACHRARPRT
jgi:hypothetical protein